MALVYGATELRPEVQYEDFVHCHFVTCQLDHVFREIESKKGLYNCYIKKVYFSLKTAPFALKLYVQLAPAGAVSTAVIQLFLFIGKLLIVYARVALKPA